MDILTNNGIVVDKDRLETVKNSKFLKMELATLSKKNVLDYYIHIYNNVELDRSNKKNSYVMWIANKVDNIDLDNPPAIKKGQHSLPDIDIDVPAEHRDEVIQYIKDKYGEEHVSQMVTFNSLMGRSAIKEVLKVFDVCSFNEMNEMTKDIPNEAEIADDLQESGETSIIMWSLKNRAKKLEKWCKLESDGTLSGDYAEIFEKAIKIEGTKKSQGKHAAGVIISSERLADVCPMVRDKEGNPIAGFEMGDLELLGHVKFDILGVDILSKIIKILESSDFTYKDLENFDDEATWDLLCEGKVKGIFQLEKQKRWTKKLRPRNIHHLAALIAIIRPGVADVKVDGKSMTEKYIDRKNGEEDVDYLFPCLEPILKKNYGIMIYQEEALRIASEIAGFNLFEADALRKAIGKKLVDKMAILKPQFINGCVNNGTLNREDATTLFEWIEKSQKYLFNASHSYSYAVLAYYSAYCKAHNLGNFYRVYLDHAERKQKVQEEIRALVNDAKLNDINVLPPNLCNFNMKFTLDVNNIYFGVSNIKDVGKTECKKIEKLFTTLDDPCNMTWMEVLCGICDKINKRAVNALLSVGALNGPSNKVSRMKMIHEYGCWKMLSKREQDHIKANLKKDKGLSYHIEDLLANCKIASNRRKVVESILSTVVKSPYSLVDSEETLSELETKYLGISLSCSKIDGIEEAIEVNSTCKEIYNNTCRSGKQSIAVEILSFREHVIKNKNSESYGQTMAFLAVEDSSACLESVILFAKEYQRLKDVLFEGNTVIITGEPSRNRDGSFIVHNIIPV